MTKRELQSYDRVSLAVVCVLLATTAGLKSVSAFGGGVILSVVDPVLLVQYRYSMLMSAGIEFAICAGILVGVIGTRVYSAVLLFCALVVWYRWASVQMEAPKACPCLGTFAGRIGIPDETARYLASLVLVTLAVISAGGLCIHWFQLKRASVQEDEIAI